MASAIKVGSEIHVNTFEDGDRSLPQIARLPNGNFIVTWSDVGIFTGGDTSGSAVRAQIFTPDGMRVGSEFLVNTETTSYQDRPVVAALSNGHVVIAWEDGSQIGGDASIAGIKAQILDASGHKIGSEFLVNTAVASLQSGPQITGLNGGGFVVTWYDYSGVGGDTSMAAVKAQVFSASGAKVGLELLVNTQKVGFQWYPSVTGLANGGFVVSWTDGSRTLGDADGNSVKAQVFSASGTKVGSEFLVNSGTSDDQLGVTVAALSNGSFVASWTDYSHTGGDASGSGIKAQIFSASGAKIGSEFLVNTETLGGQVEPSVAALANGAFVVTWRDQDSGTLGDASNASIKAQVFSAAGAKIGSEFLVNTVTAGGQVTPEVVGLSNGDFVITWDDSGQGQTRSQIKAQVFHLGNAVVPSAPVLADLERTSAGVAVAEGTATPSLRIEVFDGAASLGTVTAASDGTFSLPLAALSAGAHRLTAVASDASGTKSPASAAFVVEVGKGAEIVTKLAAYAGEADLGAILFTDRANLAFGTKAELDAARATYAPVLAKIVGSYTLTVFQQDAAGRTSQVYDEAGRLKSVVHVDANGEITVDNYALDGTLVTHIHRHDGLWEQSDYAIAGRPYASQHAIYDATGKVVSMERFYADGDLAFTQVNGPSGSSEVHNYDVDGRETVRIVVDETGERDVFQFQYSGAASSPTTSYHAHYAPGGIKQFADVTKADGSHEQTATAAGVALVSHDGVADTLRGFKNGADLFVFAPGFGNDRIVGFEAAAGAAHDVIRFDNSIVSDYAALTSHMSKVGADTLITIDATDTILVKNVVPGALTADHFQFVPHDLLMA